MLVDALLHNVTTMRNFPETTEALDPEATAEEQAARIISQTTQELVSDGGGTSPSVLASEIEKRAEFASPEAQQLVQQYIRGLLQLTRYGASIAVLPPRVGGLYDGRIKVAEQTVQVDEQAPDIAQTIKRIEEVNRHEGYHLTHHHITPLATAPSEDAATVVTIGEQQFRNEEKIIEGLTVIETGDEFVSDDYRKHMENLLTAIDASPTVSLDDVRQAVNEDHDLAGIDDAAQPGAAEASDGVTGGEEEEAAVTIPFPAPPEEEILKKKAA